VSSNLRIQVLEQPMSDSLKVEVAKCWMDVANAGGAVGFPFTPVGYDTVTESVHELECEVEQGSVIFIGAHLDDVLVGWVTLRLNRSKLTSHWAVVERLQSHPSRRGIGIGAGLLSCAVDFSRQIGLQHLTLVLRGGEQLEPFYEKHGWNEFGRHHRALRLADGDDRDEVHMALWL
jgi:GNAT superfamily N-acetyltransferase